MRRIFLASAALFACAAVDSAGAADLPPAGPLPAKAPVIAPVPVWSWNGCYAGVNGGGTRAQNHADLSPAGLYLAPANGSAPPNAGGTGDLPAEIALLSHSYDMANSGWEAGGQIGCNAQWGMAVLGVEGDWQWTHTSTSADASYGAFFTPGAGVPGTFTAPAHTEHVDVTQRWFATARVRAGFTPWERVLVYGTGGVAWANFQSNSAVAFATIPAPGFPPIPQPYNGATHIGSASSNQFGWVAGGGVEWALNNNWSVKAEYLYLRFDGFAYSSPLTAAAAPFAPGYAWNTSVTLREQVARIGVNYKFDWGPVVARY
jgi:outer membrane immunogenic protein